MNRYMSYQYKPSSANTATTIDRHQPFGYSTLSASTTSNKYQSRYRPSELPWSSSLASTSRYPLSTDTYQAPACGRPSNEQPVTSRTISGRSLFDYPAITTKINTPSSRIYDGQLRRTVTAKYYRATEHQPTTSGGDFSNHRRTTTTTSAQHQQQSNDTKHNSATSQHQSSLAKPIRSSSLKLRASYTHILDHLTTTTLAKLRLGSSSNGSRSAKPTTSSNNRQIQCQTLDERDELGTDSGTNDEKTKQPHLLQAPAIKKTSPGSTSSGLSSSGVGLDGVSPICSSPPNSQREDEISSLNGNSHARLLNSDLDHSDSLELKHSFSSQLSSATDDSANECGELVGGSGGIDNNGKKRGVQLSPVTRRLNYLNKELGGSNKNTLVFRDNLMKTGKILAELEDLDEELSIVNNENDDEDDDDDDDECDAISTAERMSVSKKCTVNMSELVLKPLGSKASAHPGTNVIEMDIHKQSVCTDLNDPGDYDDEGSGNEVSCCGNTEHIFDICQ